MIIKLNKNLSFSNNSRPLIIAEISGNHCGKKKLFLQHIVSAKKSGADLIKIQTYEPKDMLVSKSSNQSKLKRGTWKGKSLWRLYDEAHTPFNWHNDAFKLAKKLNIILFSTPFSVRALNYLKNFNPPLYKISSFEINDHKLINEIAKTKKPVIISTGMSNLDEIKKAVKIIKKHHNKIIIMYCVSGYPTPENEINIKNISFFKKYFPKNLIGLSDHTKNIWSSLAATSHGVIAIEKHFIISNKIKSNDSLFSINKIQLKELRINSEKIFNTIGKINLHLKKSEKNSKIFRRSIFATQDIVKGNKLTKKNIDCFRPNIGIGAENYFQIINKVTKKNIKKNSPIFFKDIK